MKSAGPTVDDLITPPDLADDLLALLQPLHWLGTTVCDYESTTSSSTVSTTPSSSGSGSGEGGLAHASLPSNGMDVNAVSEYCHLHPLFSSVSILPTSPSLPPLPLTIPSTISTPPSLYSVLFLRLLAPPLSSSPLTHSLTLSSHPPLTFHHPSFLRTYQASTVASIFLLPPSPLCSKLDMTLVQDSSGGVGGGDGMGGGGLVGVPAVPVGNIPPNSAGLVHMQQHPQPGGGSNPSYPDPHAPPPYPTAHYHYTPPVDIVSECLLPLLRQSPKYQDQLLAMLDGYFSTEQVITGRSWTICLSIYLSINPLLCCSILSSKPTDISPSPLLYVPSLN